MCAIFCIFILHIFDAYDSKKSDITEKKIPRIRTRDRMEIEKYCKSVFLKLADLADAL